jgi:hypothetical protein
MSDEKKEMAIVDPANTTIRLNGEDRVLHIGMKAWRKIKEEYGGMDVIFSDVKNSPFDFITDKLPNLILIGLVKKEGEEITVEDVEDWLDVYGMNDLKNKIVPALMNSILESIPEESKIKNPPRKARTK